jgi:hypothetical protein
MLVLMRWMNCHFLIGTTHHSSEVKDDLINGILKNEKKIKQQNKN